ncbi:hypothetical protein [Vibrio breoganii]|uniref:hypothetical protein n=1 Tax=Vibrio breoganii TaxID=553239 RepID=UPI001056A823|nr:hypothetical protein [Vibrio breoganii]
MDPVSHRMLNRSLKFIRDTDTQDIARIYFDHQAEGISVLEISERLDVSQGRVRTLRRGLEIRHCWVFEKISRDHHKLLMIDVDAKHTGYCPKEIAIQMHRERECQFSRLMAQMGV